jgi:hypothetical protein
LQNLSMLPIYSFSLCVCILSIGLVCFSFPDLLINAGQCLFYFLFLWILSKDSGCSCFFFFFFFFVRIFAPLNNPQQYQRARRAKNKSKQGRSISQVDNTRLKWRVFIYIGFPSLNYCLSYVCFFSLGFSTCHEWERAATLFRRRQCTMEQ